MDASNCSKILFKIELLFKNDCLTKNFTQYESHWCDSAESGIQNLDSNY